MNVIIRLHFCIKHLTQSLWCRKERYKGDGVRNTILLKEIIVLRGYQHKISFKKGDFFFQIKDYVSDYAFTWDDYLQGIIYLWLGFSFII